MARKHTYYGKGEGVLPMYHEEAIDFFLQENHMEHTIWEDADTLKPSCNGDAIEQLLHDGPLRSDVVNVYFRVMELWHRENTESVDNPSIFLPCEIQAAVNRHLLCIGEVTADVTKSILQSLQPSIIKWLGDIELCDLQNYRYLFIPMNMEWHWYLLVLDLKQQCFQCYNSMWSFNDANYNIKFASFLRFWLSDRVGYHIPETIIHEIRECPQQMPDTLDCGVYLLMYAEELTRGTSRPLLEQFKDPSLYRSWVAGNILLNDHCSTNDSFWNWYEKICRKRD
ncbi:uncharacterized protein LOC113462875 isoform X2 [Phoenix dactylifera]|nr:uncharacterized protein LOC113462875 isoform X2 [Phoenix dactylifera]